ncbi:hypothetical protein BDW60DRAFT_177155 [Aspergillus nidulans var. acristatus]
MASTVEVARSEAITAYGYRVRASALETRDSRSQHEYPHLRRGQNRTQVRGRKKQTSNLKQLASHLTPNDWHSPRVPRYDDPTPRRQMCQRVP